MTNADTLTILGISPRNSYFTRTNIGFAMDALLREKTSILVFIPDVPDIHNFLAYGYEEEKARRKAAAVGRSFRKTIHELCTDRRYSCADSGHAPARVRIIDWQSEVENTPSYEGSLLETEALYEASGTFWHDIREASAHSIRSRINYDPKLQTYFDKVGLEKGIDHAIHYILSEVAFLNIAPSLFNATRADYVYHREWPVYENFISGRYDVHRPELGFRIVSNEPAPG